MQATANVADTGSTPLAVLRGSSGWFMAEGIILVVLGMVALGSNFLMTMVTMVFLGWLLIAGGVVSTVHAFWRKRWSGFFLDLISGLLYIAFGFLVVASPGVTAELLTLCIALFLVFGGLFRIMASLTVLPPHWGWVLLNGVISLALGVMIWRQWPYSGLWVIGLFVAIEMIFNGWSLLMLGMAVRQLPAKAAA